MEDDKCVDGEQSVIKKMQQRQAECIRKIREQAAQGSDPVPDARDGLQREVAELNRRLLTKESAGKTLEQLRVEGYQHMDDLQDEMARVVGSSLAKFWEENQHGIDALRQTVESEVTGANESAFQQREREERDHEERMEGLRGQLRDIAAARQRADAELTELRVQLASAEERALALAAERDEFLSARESCVGDQARRRARCGDLLGEVERAEAGLEEARAHGEAQRAAFARLLAEEAEAATAAREAREAREAEEERLREEVKGLWAQVEDVRRAAEVQALRAEAAHREKAAPLQLRADRLRADAAARAERRAAPAPHGVDPKEPIEYYWTRVSGRLGDSTEMHQICLAYMSDMGMLSCAYQPYGGIRENPPAMMVSLDHSMWFHSADFRADEWLLFQIRCVRAGGARILAFCRVWTQAGSLIFSCAQEGLARHSEQLQRTLPTEDRAKL